MPRHFAIVPAAGSGSRFGSEKPKQYLGLLGHPMLHHTLAVLVACPEIDRVWVVLSPEDGEWDRHDWSELGPKLETLRCGGVTLVDVDRRDHVCREVDDLFEVLRGEVEQVAQAARDTLEVPNVGDRRGELDVTHPLAAHLGASDLDATALTDNALEAHPLVFATRALPVPGGAEDALAEQALLLRLEGAVVDRLGLLDLAEAPCADLVCRREADAQLVEEVDVEHVVPSLVT